MSSHLKQSLLHWGAILAAFLSLELFSKGLAFLAGILVVRHMDKTEYAWYTICNSMAGGLTNLSMLGIASGLMAVGGERIGDVRKMGGLLSAAQSLRWNYALLAVPTVLLILAFMLLKNGCSLHYVLVLLALVLGIFLIQFYQQLRVYVLQLAGAYNYPQKITFGLNLFRLGFIFILLFLGLRAWNLLGLMLGLQGIAYWRFIRPRSSTHFTVGEPVCPEAKERIHKVTKRIWPVGISAFIMPQITVLILSILGSVESVAEAGALSRLALVMSIPGAALGGIAQPWLACEQKSSTYIKKAVIVVGGSVLFALTIFVVGYILAPYILKLLGEQYSGLVIPFQLILGSVCLGFVLQAQHTLVNSKSWVKYAGFAPIITIISFTCAVATLDVHTLEGALWIPYFRVLPAALFTSFLILYGFRNHRWNDLSTGTNH